MQRIKLDPLAYMLILGVLAIQIHSTFFRKGNVDTVLETSDRMYKTAVFEGSEDRGVVHQVFRQNEVDRELLKAILRTCAR